MLNGGKAVRDRDGRPIQAEAFQFSSGEDEMIQEGCSLLRGGSVRLSPVIVDLV